MSLQLTVDLDALAERLAEVKKYLSLEKLAREVAALEKSSAAPEFWDDAQRAQAGMAELSRKKAVLKSFSEAEELLEEAQTAFELACEEDEKLATSSEKSAVRSGFSASSGVNSASSASSGKRSSADAVAGSDAAGSGSGSGAAPAANISAARSNTGNAGDSNAASTSALDVIGSADASTNAASAVPASEPLLETALDPQNTSLEQPLQNSVAQNSTLQNNEFFQEAEALAKKLEAKLSDLELSSWFSNDLDHGDAIVTITPGQGGLEAQDWCDMLFKMYLSYCAKKAWKVTVNDAPAAEVIGIDRATFTVKGENAYGMLRAESGVHRLVRISPTDEKKRRQTTFAGVEVLPVLPDDISIDIDPSDLRIDVYHASGPGGQGVNTTDSAVRITHLPTGTVVTCQNERSQLQNKAAALQILKSRLFELEQQKRAAELDELRGPKHEISFGNQIRNYVLYPYQLVKDTRTGTETGRVDSVLQDGDLDPFIVAYHRWRVAQSEQNRFSHHLGEKE